MFLSKPQDACKLCNLQVDRLTEQCMSLLGNVEDLQSHSDEDQEALRAMQEAAEAAASREQQLQEQLHVLQQHSEEDQETLERMRAAASAAAIYEQQLVAKVQDLQQLTDAAAAFKQASEAEHLFDDSLQLDEDHQACDSFQAAALSLAATDSQVPTQTVDVTQRSTAAGNLSAEALLTSSVDHQHQTVPGASHDPESFITNHAEAMQGHSVEQRTVSQQSQHVLQGPSPSKDREERQEQDGDQAPGMQDHEG